MTRSPTAASQFDARLWLQGALDQLADVTGLQPSTSMLLLLIVLLILAGLLLFLWFARRSAAR